MEFRLLAEAGFPGGRLDRPCDGAVPIGQFARGAAPQEVGRAGPGLWDGRGGGTGEFAGEGGGIMGQAEVAGGLVVAGQAPVGVFGGGGGRFGRCARQWGVGGPFLGGVGNLLEYRRDGRLSECVVGALDGFVSGSCVSVESEVLMVLKRWRAAE